MVTGHRRPRRNGSEETTYGVLQPLERVLALALLNLPRRRRLPTRADLRNAQLRFARRLFRGHLDQSPDGKVGREARGGGHGRAEPWALGQPLRQAVLQQALGPDHIGAVAVAVSPDAAAGAAEGDAAVRGRPALQRVARAGQTLLLLLLLLLLRLGCASGWRGEIDRGRRVPHARRSRVRQQRHKRLPRRFWLRLWAVRGRRHDPSIAQDHLEVQRVCRRRVPTLLQRGAVVHQRHRDLLRRRRAIVRRQARLRRCHNKPQAARLRHVVVVRPCGSVARLVVHLDCDGRRGGRVVPVDPAEHLQLGVAVRALRLL